MSNSIKKNLLKNAKKQVSEEILDYVVKNLDSVLYSTFDKLCYFAKCTRDEINEFFSALGFDDMIAFKKALRELQNQELSESKELSQNSIRSIIDLVARYELSNITELSNDLNLEALDRLAQDLLAASCVYIMGSVPLSYYATYILNVNGIRAIRLDGVASNYISTILNMDKSSMVLAFGFSRYSKSNIALLNTLKKSGYNIVSITDYQESPLAEISNYFLVVPIHSYDYTTSYTSAFMILNVLSIYIGAKDRTVLFQKLQKYDELTQSMEFFF